jgi:hypothetical protein
MKLADLLAEASLEDLERLAHDHARTDEPLSRGQLLATIESVLRSHRFLHDFLMNRQPPAFAAITLLLDTPGFAIPTSEFRDAVQRETERICRVIEDGQLLERDDQLRVYRRVLYQARSNDSLIDESESSILSVLRHELGIAQVEHFLIEHHRDLREFWENKDAFTAEVLALRAAGIIHVHDHKTMIPEDLAPAIRQVLGIDMSRVNARRLLGHFTSPELHKVLETIQAKTGGTKEERIDRIVMQMTQARLALTTLTNDRLREICRTVGTAVSGSHDELVERIVQQVASNRDIVKDVEPVPPPPIVEERRLEELRFELLFSRLRNQELAAILSELELRKWGTKYQQVRALWESNRSEQTLLGFLTSADLEGLLKRLGLRTNGSKVERIVRAIEHFESASLQELRSNVEASSEPPQTV